MNEAQIARDAGIALAEMGADEQWKAQAYDALCEVAKANPTFIVDEVWKVLRDRGLEEPDEGRAMGAIMCRAVKEHIITGTKDYRPSERRTAHANPRRVWRSLIYKPQEPVRMNGNLFGHDIEPSSSYGSI